MIHFLTRSKCNKFTFLLLILAGIFFLLAAGKTQAADSTKITGTSTNNTNNQAPAIPSSSKNLNVPTYLLATGRSAWDTQRKLGTVSPGSFMTGTDNTTNVYYPVNLTCAPGYDPVFVKSVYDAVLIDVGGIKGIFNSLRLFKTLSANGTPVSYFIWGRVYETVSNDRDTNKIGISWQIWCTRSDLPRTFAAPDYYNDDPAPGAPPDSLLKSSSLASPTDFNPNDPTNYGSGN